MLRTFISVDARQGPMAFTANNDPNLPFLQIDDIVYDNYQFADPLSLVAEPTATFGDPLVKAKQYIEDNYYRIFYPRQSEDGGTIVTQNNPWLANDALVCPAPTV